MCDICNKVCEEIIWEDAACNIIFCDNCKAKNNDIRINKLWYSVMHSQISPNMIFCNDYEINIFLEIEYYRIEGREFQHSSGIVAARALPWNSRSIQTLRFKLRLTFILTPFLLDFKVGYCCSEPLTFFVELLIPLSSGNLKLLFELKSCLMMFFFLISEYLTFANSRLLETITVDVSFYFSPA